MGKNKRLNDFEKGQIWILTTSGKTITEISKTINRSRRVIKNYLDMSENYGLRNKGGRKPKLTSRDNRMILKAASNNEKVPKHSLWKNERKTSSNKSP